MDCFFNVVFLLSSIYIIGVIFISSKEVKKKRKR